MFQATKEDPYYVNPHNTPILDRKRCTGWRYYQEKIFTLKVKKDNS